MLLKPHVHKILAQHKTTVRSEKLALAIMMGYLISSEQVQVSRFMLYVHIPPSTIQQHFVVSRV